MADIPNLKLIEPMKCYFAACAGILYFDYFLTLPAEIERFWGVKISIGAVLFFLSRYFVLIGFVPVLFEFFGHWSTCTGMKKYHDMYSGISQVVVSVLMIMRTYALYGESRRVLAMLLGIGFTALGLGLWAILSRNVIEETFNLPDFDCIPTLSASGAYRFVGAWGSVMVLDFTIFILTLLKALKLRSIGIGGLLDTMLRDGTMYFAVLSMSNFANLLSYIFGGAATRGVNTNMTTVLSSVMMSRLMLNIRDPKLRFAQAIELTTPVFKPQMGTLGTTIQSGIPTVESSSYDDFGIMEVPWGSMQDPEMAVPVVATSSSDSAHTDTDRPRP